MSSSQQVDRHAVLEDRYILEHEVGEGRWSASCARSDYDFLTRPESRQTLKDNGVVLVTWRDAQKTMYPGP